MGKAQGNVIPFARRVSATEDPVGVALRMLAEAGDDRDANAAWDALLQAALRAWSWRDPESLEMLVRAIDGVRPWVARDWAH